VAEPEEPIGSLAQETAKLLRTIAAERLKLVDDVPDPSVDADLNGASHRAAPGEHACTTAWCPICQVVGYLDDHPERVEQVTETVTDAALQIGRALRDFLDKTMPAEDD
jgi:hypothetical protein